LYWFFAFGLEGPQRKEKKKASKRGGEKDGSFFCSSLKEKGPKKGEEGFAALP